MARVVICKHPLCSLLPDSKSGISSAYRIIIRFRCDLPIKPDQPIYSTTLPCNCSTSYYRPYLHTSVTDKSSPGRLIPQIISERVRRPVAGFFGPGFGAGLIDQLTTRATIEFLLNYSPHNGFTCCQKSSVYFLKFAFSLRKFFSLKTSRQLLICLDVFFLCMPPIDHDRPNWPGMFSSEEAFQEC